MSRLRIAIVSTKRDWHGGEEQARQLAMGLTARGHDCHVLAPRSSEWQPTSIEGQFRVFNFPGRGRNPAALWSLRRYLRCLKPHVLHYNDSHSLIPAGLASVGLRIPCRVAARRVDFALNLPWQYRVLADRVICVSHAVERVCHECGVPLDRLRVVHDGVDVRRVQHGRSERGRRSLGIPDGSPLLLTVARLSDHKGHRYLLEAMPAVLEKYPDACLALAGEGELRGKLERQARQLGIDRHVRILGHRHDVPDLIMASDLFVLPSHMEGLCSSLIEVMYARRPIVATLAGGIPELVGRGGGGGEQPVAYLVPPRNPAALADAICRALAEPERSTKMTQRAYERASAHFTVDRMVEATLAVYRELVPGGEVPVTDRVGLTNVA